MFTVVDLDPDDTTTEVFAAEFFTERLTLHSVAWSSLRGAPVVLRSKVIDALLGPAYAVAMADITGPNSRREASSPHGCVDG